ncbi:MAG: hypothetical protein UT09_C0044G0001, partial [Parcubacteria group bacterium GW2011_GWF2_38_8]
MQIQFKFNFQKVFYSILSFCKMTKPWFVEQHCGIIECNSLPFIDLHHYPLFGKPNNVASKL